MRAARLAAALAGPALLIACAAPAPPEGYGAYSPPPPPEGVWHGVILEAAYPDVREGLEQVAARCWLDAELGAANLLVDRNTGDLTFYDDGGEMLAADIVPVRPGVVEVRLVGAAMAEPGRRARMETSLANTVAAGESRC
jgi:hypothetical protein